MYTYTYTHTYTWISLKHSLFILNTPFWIQFSDHLHPVFSPSLILTLDTFSFFFLAEFNNEMRCSKFTEFEIQSNSLFFNLHSVVICYRSETASSWKADLVAQINYLLLEICCVAFSIPYSLTPSISKRLTQLPLLPCPQRNMHKLSPAVYGILNGAGARPK